MINKPLTPQLHKHSVMPLCLRMSLKSKWFEMTKAGIKNDNSKSLKIFGLRFEIWKVIQGYRLSVDTKTTRYIFKPFWYTGKCKVADLV